MVVSKENSCKDIQYMSCTHEQVQIVLNTIRFSYEQILYGSKT